MATNFTDLFAVLRLLLGDREVHGSYKYGDDALTSAVRSVFLLGQGPPGYALSGAPYTAMAVEPDLPLGADCALIVYTAILNLVGGEDGAYSYTTRPLSVRDGGDRKRDILWDMRDRIAQIRDGGFVFDSFQSLAQYLGAIPSGEGFLSPSLSSGGITVAPALSDLTF